MVAVVNTSATLSDVLNYNEKKVAHNDATLIHASGFLKDFGRLNFHEKEERFSRQNELHPTSESNMLHASLNFDSSENLTDAQMIQIADRYMELMDMKNQPYLVYRHTDAGHPHVHIISTLIRPDGARMNTNNIGRNQSKQARLTIEKEFGLVPANSRQHQIAYMLEPIDVEKARYGNEKETKAQMQKILLMVHQKYKYTSLPEYNAILRQWNVMADREGKNSRTYKRGGLVYRVIGEDGKKVGVRVKASDFYFRPVLKELEKEFAKHKTGRDEQLEKIREKIADVVAQKPESLPAFTDLLSAKNIEAVIYRGKEDQVFGITFVDNELRVAVKGSDLDKGYSAAALLKALDPNQRQAPARTTKQTPQTPGQPPSTSQPPQAEPSVLEQSPLPLNVPQLLSQLAAFDPAYGSNPHELQHDDQPRKRKKR